jgi:hypothetical protein
VASAPQLLGWQQLRNNQHKIEEAKRHLSSQQEVVAWRLNWRHQLCYGWSGSDDDIDNINNNNDDNDAVTTATITTTMAVGTVRIKAGMDTAAALRQGVTMSGKCSQRQCQRQHLATTAIGTLQQ